jgi:hypothetical protein
VVAWRAEKGNMAYSIEAVCWTLVGNVVGQAVLHQNRVVFSQFVVDYITGASI